MTKKTLTNDSVFTALVDTIARDGEGTALEATLRAILALRGWTAAEVAAALPAATAKWRPW